jgi:hypothetical protein
MSVVEAAQLFALPANFMTTALQERVGTILQVIRIIFKHFIFR